ILLPSGETASARALRSPERSSGPKGCFSRAPARLEVAIALAIETRVRRSADNGILGHGWNFMACILSESGTVTEENVQCILAALSNHALSDRVGKIPALWYRPAGHFSAQLFSGPWVCMGTRAG